MKKSKCKYCQESFEKVNPLIPYCSISCQKKAEIERKKEKKVRLKEKKQKKREKKENSVTSLLKKADLLWSEAVKVNYLYTCQYCSKKENLNSHHLFTRSRKSTRLDLDNGICLCSYHHTFSSDFSAHKTGNEFFIWLEGLKGGDWIDKLSSKSREIVDFSPDFIKERILELQEFIVKEK